MFLRIEFTERNKRQLSLTFIVHLKLSFILHHVKFLPSASLNLHIYRTGAGFRIFDPLKICGSVRQHRPLHYDGNAAEYAHLRIFWQIRD